jgi:hypothetical protein
MNFSRETLQDWTNEIVEWHGEDTDMEDRLSKTKTFRYNGEKYSLDFLQMAPGLDARVNVWLHATFDGFEVRIMSGNFNGLTFDPHKEVNELDELTGTLKIGRVPNAELYEEINSICAEFVR